MPRLPLVACAAVVALSACAQRTLPKTAPTRESTRVNASFGRTWDAVVQQFANDNVPIKTIERASGFVATDRLLSVANDSADADCGSISTSVGDEKYFPHWVTYNVLVHGDSASATVRVTAAWESYDAEQKSPFACSTTGRWEQAFEGAVKAAAEKAVAASR